MPENVNNCKTTVLQFYAAVGIEHCLVSWLPNLSTGSMKAGAMISSIRLLVICLHTLLNTTSTEAIYIFEDPKGKNNGVYLLPLNILIVQKPLHSFYL